MTKKVLIVGIDSVIGFELKQTLKKANWVVYGTTRRQECINEQTIFLDLTSPTFSSMLSFDVVFLCASITKIAHCEADVAYTKQINQDAQIILARYFANRGSHVVFLSTNAVFDGCKPFYKTDDIPCPVTVYGQCKASVEQHLLSMSGYISVVRLSKVLTKNDALIKKWIEDLKHGHVIHPFHDLYLCPVSINMVCLYLQTIAEKQLFGMIHVSGEKDVTYYDLALCLVGYLGRDPCLIKPKSKAPISGQGHYASLDMQLSHALFGTHDCSVKAILKELY